MPSETSTVHEEIPTPPLSEELWQFLLDRSRSPETLVHLLKGEVWSDTGQTDKKGMPLFAWVKKGDALMNDSGIRFFSTLLYSTVTPDKIVTNLTEKEVNILVYEMMIEVAKNIAERGEEFGIKAASRGFILKLIEQNYFIGLTSSRHATILDALKPMYKRQETNVNQKSKNIPIPVFG